VVKNLFWTDAVRNVFGFGPKYRGSSEFTHFRPQLHGYLHNLSFSFGTADCSGLKSANHCFISLDKTGK
jgi:hypothetical protein